MAIARINDLRALAPEELAKRLETYGREMLEAGENPKKGKNLRKAIARIKTVLSEGKIAPGKAAAGTQKPPSVKEAKQKKVRKVA
ncbi:MAG: uL29 family ribosomal protein [Candidatus Micrarchaeota archaeon]